MLTFTSLSQRNSIPGSYVSLLYTDLRIHFYLDLTYWPTNEQTATSPLLQFSLRRESATAIWAPTRALFFTNAMSRISLRNFQTNQRTLHPKIILNEKENYVNTNAGCSIILHILWQVIWKSIAEVRKRVISREKKLGKGYLKKEKLLQLVHSLLQARKEFQHFQKCSCP